MQHSYNDGCMRANQKWIRAHRSAIVIHYDKLSLVRFREAKYERLVATLPVRWFIKTNQCGVYANVGTSLIDLNEICFISFAILISRSWEEYTSKNGTRVHACLHEQREASNDSSSFSTPIHSTLRSLGPVMFALFEILPRTLKFKTN